MELWPAIDLHRGRAVRLVRGDFAQCDDYGDPLQLANKLVDDGATQLHVVDLDAARTGEPANRDLVKAIARSLAISAPYVRLQVGGGIRSMQDVTELTDAGVERVVLGTAAIERPGELARLAGHLPCRVVLGLDYRRRADGELEPATRGWVHGSGRTVRGVLGDVEGLQLAGVVVTSIDRDGTLEGPDLDGLASILDDTEVPVVASGGVAGAADLRVLAALRSPRTNRSVAGVVVGKAILDGRVTVQEASESCAPSG